MSAGRVLTTAVVVLAAIAATCKGLNQHYFTVSPGKDSRCHSPMITNCNTSLYPVMDYKLAGWFFHTPFKSCRPVYTAGGVHNCTINKDIPLTKSECEDLCAEECVLGNGSMGICMLEEHCKVMDDKTTSHPRPCGAYNVNCCARTTTKQLSSPITEPAIAKYPKLSLASNKIGRGSQNNFPRHEIFT